MVTVGVRGGLFALGQGSAEVAEVVGELVDVVETDGVVHGVAGGTDADRGIRVFYGLLCEDGDEVWDEGLELPAGEVVGLLVELPLESCSRKAGSSSHRRRVLSETPESREAWAMEGERATTGRKACWRGVRAEVSISRSIADISGVWGLLDWTEPSSGERRGDWEPVALLGFLDIEHFVPQWLPGFGPSVAVVDLHLG